MACFAGNLVNYRAIVIVSVVCPFAGVVHDFSAGFGVIFGEVCCEFAFSAHLEAYSVLS